MAWNNVRTEPRREWIEQILGLLGLGLFILIVHLIVSSFGPYKDQPLHIIMYLLVPTGLFVTLLLLVVAWYLAHPGISSGFHYSRFRKIQDKPTSIEIFRQIARDPSKPILGTHRLDRRRVRKNA